MNIFRHFLPGSTQSSPAKGQRKSKWFFQADVSYKKRTNEFDFTTMIPQVDLFSFVFWKKLKTPKRRFEINWPLSSYFLEDIELFRPLWTGRWTQRGHFLIPQHESLRVLNLFLLFSAFFFRCLGGGAHTALPCKLVSFIFKVSSLMRFLGERETRQ